MESVKLIIHFSTKKRRKEGLKQKQESNMLNELKLILAPINVVVISLIVVGSLFLIQVGSVLWNDVTVWGKDINLIFFGSRTNENISMGIGIQLIHYNLIGIVLLVSAVILFILNRWHSKSKPWTK